MLDRKHSDDEKQSRSGAVPDRATPAYEAKPRDHPFGGKHVLNTAESVLDPFEFGTRGQTTPKGFETLPTTATQFILYFAMQAKFPFILMLIIGGLVGLTDATLYWSIGWLIDLLERSNPETFLTEHWLKIAGLVGLLLVVRGGVLMASAVIEQNVIVPRFFTSIRWQSFRAVMEQPYAFFQDDFAGRIATKVFQTGDSVGDFIIGMLQTIWFFVTFVVLAFAILTAIDPWMGVVIICWVIGYVVLARIMLPKLRAAAKSAANARSITTGRLVDTFTNIMAVKLFDGLQSEHSFVREGFEMQLDEVVKLTRSITMIRAALALLNGVMMSIVTVLAVVSWTNGTVTTGSIAVTMGLVFRLNQMSGWMMFNINGLIRSFATVQDSIGIVSVQPTLEDQAGAKPIPPSKGEIVFNDVTFDYGREEFEVLHNLSFRIAPGERVAFVGPSAAGKTTIVNLMLRLFDVEDGQIFLDENDVRSVTQASLRAQFGVVSQEPILMHRSLRDNIAYGCPDATEEDIIRAAKKARAHDFIVDVEDPKGRKGYNAHVGERGVKLSGGQRQRVAIARVFLKDAPILILDEATSSLDSEVEAAIQESLETLMEGKTVIAIAHRLSTIASLDRLLVVNGGQIVEEGPHSRLKKGNGLYARLWKRQSGGFLGQDAGNA